VGGVGCVEFNRDELERVLREYRIVLSGQPRSMHLTEMAIDTDHHQPIIQYPYCTPESLLVNIREELDALWEKIFITQSNIDPSLKAKWDSSYMCGTTTS